MNIRNKSAMFAPLLLAAASVNAGSLLLDETTDTVLIDGSSIIGTALTIEAVVKMDTDGSVYNEWQDSEEDKSLKTDSGFVFGDLLTNVHASIDPGVWNHIALVYDGSELRYYVDGELMEAAKETGDVPDYPGRTVIGAIDRSVTPPDTFRASMLGLIDSLRISDSVRYTGTSFPPHRGDFHVDADSIMVFNFNGPASATQVIDLASSYIGTFGTGFTGATSPTLVAESSAPCNPADLALPFGVLDLNDAATFSINFLGMNSISDLNGDGFFDLTDISLFVNAFLSGCP